MSTENPLADLMTLAATLLDTAVQQNVAVTTALRASLHPTTPHRTEAEVAADTEADEDNMPV